MNETVHDPETVDPGTVDPGTVDPGTVDPTGLFPPAADEPAALARLHARLGTEADRDGLLDVGYRTLATPVGELLLAATGRGLVRVAYPNQDHEAALDALARVVGARVLRAPGRLDEVSRQMEEYFAGRRTRFELPLDLRLSSGFRRAVLDQLVRIDYGRTRSYKQLAEAAGSPRAFRAVGTACATNPLPVVLPCHRVLPSTGAMGQYAGGAAAKRTLLQLEGAGVAA